jgi:hypothetical protein
MTTTVKSDAVAWLTANFGVRSKSTYASKFYVPEKSRTKRATWWIEIPDSALQSSDSAEVHILCQKAPDGTDFHYLRVPVGFLRANLPRLAVRERDQISLFLSAEPEDTFVDQRGRGRVNFIDFLVA